MRVREREAQICNTHTQTHYTHQAIQDRWMYVFSTLSVILIEERETEREKGRERGVTPH